MQDDQTIHCRSCARTSDWEFIGGFYHREESARRQAEGLQSQVAQLNAALQHAGLCAQQDRVALNKSHAHLDELQAGYNIAETARARCENDLHEERQEHIACKEALDQERRRHSDTKKDLSCVWNAHNRLGEIISKYHGEIAIEIEHGPPLKVADLILELEAKAAKISNLQSSLMQVRDDIEDLKAKHDADAAQQAKDKIELIGQLQSAFQPDQPMVNTLSPGRREPKKSSWRGRPKTKGKPPMDDTTTLGGGGLKMEDYIKVEEV